MREGEGRRRGSAARAAAPPWALARRETRSGAFGFAAFPAWLVACVRHEVETRRLFPWLAVAFGLGILAAFAADGPLSPWPPLLVGMAVAAGAVAARARFGLFVAIITLAAVFFGFAAAVVRMRAVETPVLARLTLGKLGGFIETVEERSAGGRLVVRVATLDRVADAERPNRVRVTVRTLGDLKPGDYVAGSVRLLPPPEAARPGGYDFARDAYFRGIGAVGSGVGRLARVDPSPIAPDLGLRAAALVDRARNALTNRIAGTIGGQAGAVAAALVTGKRGLIEERTNDVLRAAGIYHVVSISGLHMVLAAGTFFWLARAFLALSPALALRWPIKKFAAVVGMAGATAYCIFSGSEVATERALIMILIMQGAILFDRPALSLRNLALSAILVLTREPEALLGPSFQMSYAAVAGLIAFAEWQRGRAAPSEPGDPIGRAFRFAASFALGMLMTTVIATLATGPFGSYHFQTLQPYGLVGNAATLPLVSLAVMPAAVLGVLALPFGLDRPIWALMGYAVQAVLALSTSVADLGGSTVVVPAFGPGALALFVAALLLVTLPGSALRVLAIVPAALGFVALAASTRPDIYIARDGSGAAIRAADGRLALVGRVPAFTAEQWTKADGDARKPTDPSLRTRARCDAVGCTVAMADGRVIAFASDARAFEADCRRAALVISRLTVPETCAARAIDRRHLAAHGATALRARPADFTTDTVRKPREARPWFPARAAPPQSSAPSRPERDSQAAPGPPDTEPPPLEAPDGDPYQ